MNIILIGFSGCGKTTIGKEISHILGMGFIDIDSLIEQKLSIKIEYIFKYYGQKYFRYMESETIKELCKVQNKVISAGGGAFINPININNLKNMGIVFFVNAPLNEILKDNIISNRPLLKNEDINIIQKLYDKRLPFYRQADVEINTENKTSYMIAKEIINIFCSKAKNCDNIK